MAWLALAIYGIWMAVAFGFRSWVQVRRTGDSGFRGISGRIGTAEWWAGVLFVVALVGGAVAPVLALLGLDPLSPLDRGWVALLGAGIAATGVVLTLVAQLDMGESWRVGVDENERTELVVQRSFRVVRNPIFSAMAMTASGLALLVPNLVAVVSVGALVAALELQVRVVEEPYLRTAHGSGYLRYGARVGRFVPGLGRLRGATR
jgi:protein-S-isoprenylcysteine O-methyltransferase Ste14